MRAGLRLPWRRDDSSVAGRSRAMLAQLDLPPQFSVAGICRSIEAVTSRPIVLHPMPPGWGPAGLCGVLASTADTDHVLYTADGSRIGQATTIVHECGHILFDVERIGALLPARGGVDLELLADVLPASDVTRVRGRTDFSDFEEKVVETFASSVLRSGLAGALDRSTAPGSRLADRFG